MLSVTKRLVAKQRLSWRRIYASVACGACSFAVARTWNSAGPIPPSRCLVLCFASTTSLVILSRFHVEFMYIDWYLRGCENVRKLLKLRLVVVEGGMATRIVCCAESQNTGSPPLLSDLYWVYVCWMEHEGLPVCIPSEKDRPIRTQKYELVRAVKKK